MTLRYDELPEDIKDTVIDELGDINVDYDWWEYTIEDARSQWLEKYGIDFNILGLYFDLGRSRELYFRKGTIWVDDQERLLSALAPEIALELALDEADFPFAFSFDTHYYGGGGRTILQWDDYRNAEAPEEIMVNVEEWFYDLCRDLLRVLEKEYNYLTSREAIEESIRANDYWFTNDGKKRIAN